MTDLEASLHRSIANTIRQGDYYRDALRWYASCHLRLYTQNFYWRLLTMVTAFALGTMLLAIYSLLPLRQFVLYMSPVSTLVERYSAVESLGERTDQPYALLAKYFLSLYIQAYESYDPLKPNHQQALLEQLSATPVLTQHHQAMDETNPTGWKRLLRDRYARYATIDRIQLVGGNQEQNRAVVYYTVTVHDRATDDKRLSHHVVSLLFVNDLLPLPTSSKETARPFRFQVLSYRSNPLS